MADFPRAISETGLTRTQTSHTNRRSDMTSRLKTSSALFLFGCLLWSVTADAQPRLRTFSGGFTSSQITEGCDSLCTGGPLTGGLAGSLYWHMDSMEATNNRT